MAFANLEVQFARGLNVAPNTIFRKIPYLKLLAWLRILDLEEEQRQTEAREQKVAESMRSFPETFRRMS